MYKKQQDAQIQRFYSAATCKCRQLSRSTNKLHSYTVTRPPAEADSYRVRCPRGTSVLELKHFVPRPPASADSYRVRPTSYIPTLSHVHLRMQAAIALHVEEALRSANSNILFRGHLPVQTAIALDQTSSFLHRHAPTCANILFRGHLPVQTAIAFDQQNSFRHRRAATCGRRQLSR